MAPLSMVVPRKVPRAVLQRPHFILSYVQVSSFFPLYGTKDDTIVVTHFLLTLLYLNDKFPLASIM